MQKIIPLIVLALLFGGVLFSSLHKSKQEVVPQAAQTIEYKKTFFDIYYVDLNKQDIEFYWKNDAGEHLYSLQNLKDYLASKNKKLLLGTNGGMYLKNRQPQGWYIENGEELAPLDTKTKGYGNFYMQPNGVFLLANGKAEVLTTKQILKKQQQDLSTIDFATQSGPMLVIDGKIHPAFNLDSESYYIRSGVGVIDDTHLVFAISNEEVNFYTFADLFKTKLGCKNALYLDGAISKMYLPEINRHDLDGKFGCMIGVVDK